MEIKELLKAFDLPEDIDTPEKAVAAHNSKYISLSEAHIDDRVVEKVTGKTYGSLTTTAKKLFDLKNEEIKDKKYEEILALGINNLNNKIKELSTNTGDEKITKLTAELETIKGQAIQYKTDLDKVVNEKTELETGFNNKLKEFKIGNILKDAKGKLVFADGVKEVEKIGFDAILGTKYKFDLDEHENPIVYTKEGKPVKNPLKTGTYLTLDEVLDSELKAAGLDKKNNLRGGQPFQFQNNDNTNNSNSHQQQPARKINSKALEMAEKETAAKK